jgi:hypothetical protein
METDQAKEENIEDSTAKRDSKMEESEGMHACVAVLILVSEGPELIQATTEDEHVLHETVISDSLPDKEDVEHEDVQEQNESKEEESEEPGVNDASESTEKDVLIEPTPISNPLLQSVLDIAPPTPRDASPLQIAIENIHPSAVDGETLSPVERKEEEVQFPTEVCEFPVISKEEDASEETTDGMILCRYPE